MSAPLPLNAPHIPLPSTSVFAALSVVVATCSVAVTLAVTSGGGGAGEPGAAAVPKPEIAEPDAATLYHHRAMERRR
jgi:hypothetical protein